MTHGQDAARPADAVAELLDAYLVELAGAGTADLDVWAARLARGDARERFRREALAEEFAWRQSRGEPVVLEEYAARLREEADRKAFAEIVRANRLAERALPPQLAPGALLGGRYRIRSLLGRGGMSVVFAAWDQELERDVAIKVFNADARAGSPEEWETIAHGEAAALAQLDHPNVVRVHDIRRDHAQTFIVMDRVSGVDLSRVLEELRRQELEDGADPARRPERLRALVDGVGQNAAHAGERASVDRIDARSWPRTVARILAPVAAGIEVAHGLGQVHRDLKPNNVILRRGADPVVLDFGLSARVRPGAEDSGVLRGTPEYFAPEQARDLRSGSDVRTDVYQLGLVLYEMLSLERAQHREKTEDILRFLARVSLGPKERVEALPRGLPRALRAICARALAANPAARYASAGEMARDLERFAAGLPNVHARTGTAHGTWQRATWLARQPAFAALLLGGLALGGGVWLRGRAQGAEETLFFAPFHFTPFATSPVAIGARQERLVIAEGSRVEILGVEVETATGAWIYGLGVTGNAEGEKGVYPQRPRVLGAREAQSGWALRVEAGSSTPVEIYRFDGQDPEEGVLVIARDERSDAIERWLAALDAEVSASGRKPVPYERALADFERVAKTRVRGVVDPDAAQAERDIFQNLVFKRAASQGASADGRIKWFQQILQVSRGTDGKD
ncbi:MAG: serine/threonine protein kinase [Planctomycetes bacterium]|nr:serine/threonine protein kinase [Planctomycetota bacterium]